MWGRLIDEKQGLVNDVDIVNIRLKTMRGRGRGKQIKSCGGRVNTAGMDKKGRARVGDHDCKGESEDSVGASSQVGERETD